MIVFYGALAGRLRMTLITTLVMAVLCATSGLYFGTRLASTSTNREHLIRKLLIGAFCGFIVCVGLMVLAMLSFRFRGGKEITFVITMIVYVISVIYLGYVTVFVVLPGHDLAAEQDENYVWGVIRMYIHVSLLHAVSCVSPGQGRCIKFIVGSGLHVCVCVCPPLGHSDRGSSALALLCLVSTAL